jgi:hypothetical protein
MAHIRKYQKKSGTTWQASSNGALSTERMIRQSKEISLPFTIPKTTFWEDKLSRILPIRLGYALS